MTSPLRTPANATALVAGHAMISAHRETFAAFAGGALAATDDREAIALTEMAYAWAFRKHPGAMLHAPLERLVNEIGRRRVPGGPPQPRPGTVRSVLHVATEVYDYGGHTRVLERWIERDRDRRSTLMLLRHGLPLPPATARAIERAGATVVRPQAEADVFQRARDLRAVAAEHDLVVLHVHPYETIAALAFADPAGRPPVLCFNHASHQLWLGVAATDVVASLWEPDREIAVRRRGFADDRSVVLPLPAAAAPAPDREATRRARGIGDDVHLIATVASPYKVQHVLEPSFAEICSAILDRLPDVYLLAAGPEPGDAAIPDHPRAHALGIVPDLAPMLASADLLLDTWPASGGTVVIDAAAAGLPIVSLGDGDPADAMVRPPAGLLGGAVHLAATVDELVETITTLLADDAGRRATGERAREFVADTHAGDGWHRAMEAAVARALAHAGSATVPEAADAEPTDAEAVLALLFADAHAAYTAYDAYIDAAEQLPASQLPRTEHDVRLRVNALLARRAAEAANRPRAVAAPAVDAVSISSLIAEVRTRIAADQIGSCLVVVPPDEVEAAVALLEAALATGCDVDLELVAGAGVGEVARAGDLVLGG